MSEFLKRLQGMSANRLALLANELQTQLQQARAAAIEPIAIVGMAGRYPGGETPDAFWSLLTEGRDALEDMPRDRWDVDGLYDPDPDAIGKIVTRRGSFLRDFDHFDAEFFGISPREAETIDPQHRLLLEVAWEALEDTGVSPDARKGTRSGVFVGICTNDFIEILTSAETACDGYLAQGTAHSIAAGRLAYVLGLEGPCLALDTACSSSLVAAHYACKSLQSRECDLALAGGVSILLSPWVSIDFSRARILSPSGLCRPFDARADGYVRGEGCGMFVLKRLSDAQRDGDTIRAVIRGSAVNHGGRSSGLLAPKRTAQEAVIRAALEAAQVEPSGIRYVEASSVGTLLGDPMEIDALQATLCRDRTAENPLVVGSVKTNIGHLEGASGAAALAKVVLSLEHEAIPPNVHFEQPSPHIDWRHVPVRVPREVLPWRAGDGPRLAAVSSFGLNGTNAHLILEEGPARRLPSEDAQGRAFVLPLSAKTEGALGELVSRFAHRLEGASDGELPSLCYTASTGRVHHPRRLAVVGASTAEALQGLRAAIDERRRGHVGQGRAHGPTVALVFPSGEDVPLSVMAEVAELALPEGSAEPSTPHGAAMRDTLKRASKETRDAAWFCAQVALAQLWRRFGVEPTHVLGEGTGELAAACVAGLFSVEAGLELARARSELQGDYAHSSAGRTETGGRPDGVRGLPSTGRYREALARVTFEPEQIRIVSGVSGRRTGRGELADEEYWLRQLGGSSRFRDGVSELKETGVDLVLVLGLDERAIREDLHPLGSLSSDRSLERCLADSLAALYASGVDVDWDAVFEGAATTRVSIPTYPFERRRYWPEAAGPRRAEPLQRNETPRAEEAPAETPADARALRGLSRDERARFASDRMRQELGRVLGCEAGAIDPDASLLDLGLDSIRALQLKDRLTAVLGTEIPIASFVTTPSIRALAELVAERTAESEATELLAEIVPDSAHRYEPFPLTDIQQAYWVGRNAGLDLGGVATHAYFEYEIENLDVLRLEWAVGRAIERHDMLRATILPDGRQVVREDVPAYRVESEDLRDVDASSREKALDAIRERMSHEVRPADRWPLFEIRASLLPGSVTRLHVSVDLLIVDAWSLQVLAREVATLYESPESPLPPLELGFRDCVLASSALEHTEIYQRSRRYWVERLPQLPPAPELPLAKASNAVGTHRFVRRTARLERGRWERLQARSRYAGLSPTVGVLAAFAHVLREWSRTPRFTVNLTLFHRPALHPRINEVVGDFTSLTLLEADLRGEALFEERAQTMQRQLWSDLDHRYFGGVRVLRELALREGRPLEALMPVVFTAALGAEHDLAARDSLLTGELVYAISQTPQVWLDHQVFESDGELVLVWDAVEELFPNGVLDDMFDAYGKLLERLSDEEDSAWREPVGSLTPASQLERRRAVNGVAAPVSNERLEDLFRASARRAPDRPALFAGNQGFTYAELSRRADALARRLYAVGAANERVAIVMEKGWEQVVACLAVVASGAAYVPIDPRTPETRLHYLIEHCGVRVVLTQERFRESLIWPARVSTVLSDFPDPGAPFEEPAAQGPSPLDVAYVIFTSGSSGLPKGVTIDHRGAVNTILDVNRRFSVGPDDRVLSLSSLSFDLSVWDVFGLLAAGGSIVLPAADSLRDPAHWLQLLEEREVTVWNSVPALMQLLCQHAAGRSLRLPRSLRLVLLSGDWVPVGLPDSLRSLSDRGRELEIVSLGGATEASIWSIFHPIDVVDESLPSIPYGTPLANQALHVLDDLLRPRPDWVAGDLYIEGLGLAQGYWGEPEKTRAAFFEHPRTGKRLYRTGDLARYFPDGTLEFLGRADSQVKVQGYRIELGEVEFNLRQHPRVEHAVALVAGDSLQDRRLVACAVPSEGGEKPSREELREFLAARLPEYMVPSSILVLDALPLTGNGKVDPGGIASLLTRRGGETADASGGPPAPADELTEKLIELVKRELQLPELDARTNLLALGASSLDMLRLVNEIEQHLGFRPKVEEFFRRPTIEGLRDLRQRWEANESVADTGGMAPGSSPDVTLNLVMDPAERDALKRESLEPRAFDEPRRRVVLPLVPTDARELAAFAMRRTHREFDERPIGLTQLSSTLGCLRRVSLDGQVKHRYASAGGLYPLQTYLFVKPNRVEGLAQGTYYYDPIRQDLVLLREGAEIGDDIHVPYNQPVHRASAFSIFLVAQTRILERLYGDLGIHLACLEAGLMTQLLDTTGPEQGIGFCQIGTIRSEGIRDHFELDDGHVFVHLLLGGRVPGDALRAPSTGALERADEQEDREEGVV